MLGFLLIPNLLVAHHRLPEHVHPAVPRPLQAEEPGHQPGDALCGDEEHLRLVAYRARDLRSEGLEGGP